MVEKCEITVVIAYIVRNTILGENVINWIDQLYVIIERPPAFDLDGIVIGKIHEIINKYNLTNLQNIDINLKDLKSLTTLEPMFNLLTDQRLTTNPYASDCISIHYVNGLWQQQTIDFLKKNYPNVDFYTSLKTHENLDAIRQRLDTLTQKDKEEELNILCSIKSLGGYQMMEERIRVVPAYQTALREVFDASHKFSQKKFLNVSLSDLLTSRTNFTYVVKNFATGLYNFFKGYMSTPSVVETPLDTTSLNGNNVQNRRVLELINGREI
jgi:hypothetical protein